MKTAVYGGTFNPIHRGHIHILGEFMERLALDRALLIPDGAPPHKQALDLAPGEHRLGMCRLDRNRYLSLDSHKSKMPQSGEHRLGMCRLAAEALPGRVEVSPIELERPGRSYTSDTLAQLNGLFPGEELYLLMGEDMFLTVDRWHAAEEIFRRAVLCASPRSPAGLED